MKTARFDNKRNGNISVEKETTVETRASSIYRELVEEGCQPNDIISVSTHLISYVTSDLKMRDD